MVVLGLVGAPAAPMSYAAYNALAAGGSALGATFGAAKSAALAAMASTAALALGAGVGGFLLGQAILEGLNEPQVLPDMGEYFEAGAPQQLVKLVYDYYVNDQQLFSDQPSQFLLAPVKGIFFRIIEGASTWFVFDGNGVQQTIVSTTNTSGGTRFELKGFINGNNETIAPTKRLPSYVPKNPDRPQPRPPTPIPIPGVPDLPITPVVVPNPGNDDGEEGEERPPGLVVQIPQTGQQIRFTPEGVYVTNYNAQNREPYRIPPPNIPPGGTTATPRCCDDGEPEPPDERIDEIICRVKALQETLLDDGYTFITGVTPTAQSGSATGGEGEWYRVNVDVISRPANLRIQPSTNPAPDVWYVGWFSWVSGGFPGDRQPLHFKTQTFLAPPNVDGFIYQLNAGCAGTAIYERRVRKPYVDLC